MDTRTLLLRIGIGVALTLGFLFAIPVHAYAAIARVELDSATVGNAVNFGTPTTQGELIVVAVVEGHSGTSGNYTVSDNEGQTYTRIFSTANIANGWVEDLWYVQNSVAGVSSVTASVGAGNNGTYSRYFVAHYTGVATSSVLDTSAAPPSSGEGSPWASSSITPTQNASELLVGTMFGYNEGSGVTFTPDAGWSTANQATDGNNDALIYADQIVSNTSGNYAFAGTIAGGGSGNYPGVAAFKSGNGGGGSGGGSGGDNQPPTVPQNLGATAISSSQINLTWSPSSDNVGVAGYDLYRCQGSGCTPSFLTTTPNTSYSDTNLQANTTYTYTVAAYDAAGNTSGQSSPANATTQSSGGGGGGSGGSCPTGANYWNTNTNSYVTLSSLGITNCYYVAANGNDSNSGTSESSPWLHAPQMPNCSGNCATAQNQNDGIPAGTGIIFRGGDTWHFGNSGASPYTGGVWNFNIGQTPMGTSAHPMYIGVDKTWYAGGSWSRPILTADNPLCNASTLGSNCFQKTDTYGQTSFYVNSCAYQIGSQNTFLELSALQYYIVDNFEMTGLCQSDVGQPGHHDDYVSYGSIRGPMTFEDLYIHGWSHLPFAGLNGSTACTATTVCVNIFAFTGGANGTVAPDTIYNNVVDGSDSDGPGAGLCFGGFTNEAYNVFRYTSQCIPNPIHTFHDNLYEYFFENGHSNMIEALNDSPGTNAIYNNVFRHIENNVTSGGGVGIWLSPHPGTTDYLFNNLMYDVGDLEYINVGNYNTNYGNETFFNNTFQINPSQTIFNCEYLIGGTLTNTNNHLIDNESPYLGPCSTLVTTNPLVQTNATATADGYTTAETYAYSPPTASSPTVGAGANVQSYCSTLATAAQSDPTLANAASACASDTTYACTYNTANHTVSCPDRTVTARPASASWDIGAYQYSASGGGSGGGDNTPPTVSITSPTNGATVSSTISVQANASDNVGVTEVQFYLDSTLMTTDFSSPYIWSWNTASSTNGSHTLSAKAYDAAGNVGISSNVVVTVANVATPPSIPTGLAKTGATTSSISLSWNASTPGTYAISGYKVYRNTNQVGNVNQTSFADTGLTPSTTYSYTVSAYDTQGNSSASSSPLLASTLPLTNQTSSPSSTLPEIISFTANPGTINQGSPSTLSWLVTGNPAPVVSISTLGQVSGSSVQVTPSETTTYTLTAENSQGTTSTQATVTVNIPNNGGGGGGGGSSGGGGGGGGGGSSGGGGGGGGSSGSGSGSGSGSSGSTGSSSSTNSGTSGSGSSGSSQQSLASLLASLLQEVEALITQLNTQLVATFTRNLTLGSSGQDVKNLQVFLNDNGYTIATTGAGSPGDESTYFGAKTAAALAKFQAANQITPTSGILGPKTRAYLEGKW